MTRPELAKALAHACPDLPAHQAELVLRHLPDVLAAELKSSGKIELHMLGHLKVTERSARKGRNPRTGESIDIPAKQVVTFKPHATFTKAVNG